MNNYPDDIRSYDRDHRSPFYSDPTETPAFEETKTELMERRIRDVEGYFLEAFTEADTPQLKKLSEAVLLTADGESTLRIGEIVRKMVESYCEPNDEEVIEDLNQEEDS